MLIDRITRLFSPEDGAGTTTVEEPETTTTAPAKETEEEPAKDTSTAKATEPETEEDGVELEGMEELEDGRVKLTFGNSVYYSKAGLEGPTRQADVWRQARNAVDAKDKAFLEMKARASIKPPDGKDDVETAPRPDREKILTDTVKASGLDPRMATWGPADWKQYKLDKELESEDIIELKDKLKDARLAADSVFQTENATWYNKMVVNQATENIRDYLVAIGANPDEFADAYHEVLSKVVGGKDHKNENGYVIAGRIEREMAKAVSMTLKPKQESALKKKIEEQQHAAKVAKTKIKTPGSSAAKLDTQQKPAQTIKEATARALKSIGTGP